MMIPSVQELRSNLHNLEVLISSILSIPLNSEFAFAIYVYTVSFPF